MRPLPQLLHRPFTGQKRRPVPADGALVHSMAEKILLDNGVEVPAWEFLEEKGLSVHALIYPDGGITIGVPGEDVAYHAGVSEFEGRQFLNGTFLGAEFIVPGALTYKRFAERITRADCYSEEQYQAGGWLYAEWLRTYPAMTKGRIVGHSLVSPGRKIDPGTGFDWPRFMAAIDGWLAELG